MFPVKKKGMPIRVFPLPDNYQYLYQKLYPTRTANIGCP